MNLVIGNDNDNAQIEANMSVVHNIISSNVEGSTVPQPRELQLAA